MATTTYEALRDAQLAAIEAINPGAHSRERFARHRAERDFRSWAEAAPKACFRRFAVEDLHQYDPIDASDMVQEPRFGRGEIVIAYPTDFRYGSDNVRDLNDLIRRDTVAIINAAGYRASHLYTDAAVYQGEPPRTEQVEGVTFLVIEYRFFFWESCA